MDQRITSSLLIFLALFHAIVSVRAQSTNSDLEMGVPVTGRIAAGQSEDWQIFLRAGELISLQVEASDDTLDPVLNIRGVNGNRLITVDDYAYPDRTDVLLEAFTAPRNGLYTLSVSGYGNTAGDYELLAHSGYADVAIDNALNTPDDWQQLERPEEDETPAEITFNDSSLTISQEGIETVTIQQYRERITPDFYAQMSVNLTARNGWRTGMVLFTDDDSRYEIVFNQLGSWRVQIITDDSTTTLSDWRGHPAITVDSQTFDLALLVRQGSLDVFYDGSFLDTILDESLTNVEQIGVLAGTANAVGSLSEITFSNLQITTPFLHDDERLFPQQVASGVDRYVVQSLQRRGLLPPGGQLALNLSEGASQSIQPGITLFRLMSSRTFKNFVLGARISWQITGDGIGGCGLVVNQQSDTDYVLAYVDSAGGYGLSHREDNNFHQGLFEQTLDEADSPYTLLIIALGETLHLYVEGEYRGNIQTALPDGGIAEAVVNFDAVNTACLFQDVWLWEWQEN